MNDEARNFYHTLFPLWQKLTKVDQPEDIVAKTACEFLEALAGLRSDHKLPAPFCGAVEILYKEFEAAPESRQAAFRTLANILASKPSEHTLVKAIWQAFFPEALYLNENPERQIPLLREKRQITILEPASTPISQPAKQILFTSNVLLSPPPENAIPSGEAASIIREAMEVNKEEQAYWYDHPIPIGISEKNDEVLYGLKGLAQALEFEKNRGTAQPADRMRVCLSVSVTHRGLHRWARPWLKARIASKEKHSFEHLDMYAFTEQDTIAIVDLLSPWIPSENREGDVEALKATFGVDGEYGRHYSFLKALPAIWSVLEDPNIQATFKIDLDQVFPQEILVKETGKSAFEHFSTPLWGALAQDSQGKKIKLGLLAGALVNEKDISQGLFTPDIPWPENLPEGKTAEDMIFFKQLPMAVSTRAELMTRYETGGINGETEALQRIHVTGGTNGIRIDSLRQYQPFTPSFIGRAEDQAYILSVLTPDNNTPPLRYAHASGLFMRHDKEAFATAAIQAGKAGAYIGDLVRLFTFSAYTNCLPGTPQRIKDSLDPFTGCFITPIPATLALLRLALHLISSGNLESKEALLQLAGKRLPPWIHRREEQNANIFKIWQQEKRSWGIFYKAIEHLEAALKRGDENAKATASRFKTLIENCRV